MKDNQEKFFNCDQCGKNTNVNKLVVSRDFPKNVTYCIDNCLKEGHNRRVIKFTELAYFNQIIFNSNEGTTL